MLFFFFNATATTEIYTLSLHDALPICGDEPDYVAALEYVLRNWVEPARLESLLGEVVPRMTNQTLAQDPAEFRDRKSTRLNSSHSQISYAVFCLKKKKKKNNISDGSQK